MAKISKADQEKLEALFDAGAARMPSEPEYWINGGDEGASYCFDCCELQVAKLLREDPDGDYAVDGGYGLEGDYTPFCESCGKLLENSLTDGGCKDEVDHFLLNGFDPKSDDDCRAMSEVISSMGWELWADMIYGTENEKQADAEYFDKLYVLCERILKLIVGVKL